MTEGAFAIPPVAWRRRFDEPLDLVRKSSSSSISFKNLIKMLPMIVRLQQYISKRKAGGFDPMNLTQAKFPGPYQGVPLGGIGSGSIGRGWRGEFRRWQLRSGYVQNPPVWADQFSLFVRHKDQKGRAVVLFPGAPREQSLSRWEWASRHLDAEYQALFPRAWTTYDDPLPDIRLTCRQFSPVIGHNYKESCYPVSEFRWKIENLGLKPAEIGLMFTFQNGMGLENDCMGGHHNTPFMPDGDAGPITGVLLNHAYWQVQSSEAVTGATPVVFEDPLTFAIAARPLPGSDAQITYRTRFQTSGDGSDVWEDFEEDGRLDNQVDDRPSVVGESIGAALAMTLTIPPGESRELAFSLAWDMPIFRSGLGTPYYRRYSRYYGKAGSAAQSLAVDMLDHADEWEAQVVQWQNAILNDETLPDWYRCALFNELYYLVDGGTVWVDPMDGPLAPDSEMGHFAYLEGHEYRMYNTYDVHFYASFALLKNWPRVELALQRDIAEATLKEYSTKFTELYSGRRAPRKLYGAVPHDIGWPDEDPWLKVNGYFLHDVNHWKDLNPKFVLQVYRDYLFTGDKQFVLDTWEAVEAAIRHVQRFDRDGDGLIENDGFPDQTYDVWPVKGPSAYTGGLWLACLSAGAELAEIAGEPELAEEYCRILVKGKKAYQARLWNGRYFNYDSSRSRHHDSIMADQLAGQWYSRACGLPSIVESAQVRSALLTIYDWNVHRFGQGRMGAVNGMRPDGRIDRTSMQSQEVWSGTTYALAAGMLYEDLHEAAFQTAWGVYNMTYNNTGYWFQTPEAWDENGNYRAISYMRPLSIWAMQWALERIDRPLMDSAQS
jgi:non-lysosomal glucosylceramidase